MPTVRLQVSGRADAAALLRQLATVRPVDGLLVVGFDADGRLTGVGANDRHRSLSWVKVWELAELARQLEAHALLVGAFPRGPGRAPSAHEITAFAALDERSERAGVLLLDCIVLRGERWWSLRELGRSASDA